MATATLQDFLVSVKYQVDTASQNTFLGGLKSVATSVGGVTAEIGLLAAGLFKLSETMAKAGETIYWMSQRLGSSVKGIQEAAFALSNVGVSAGEAYTAMETFGDWMRRTGPAANAQLRMMGVTATDTRAAFVQLGQELAKRGGTYEFAHGTDQQRMQYAITRSWAESIPGMTEKIMLAAVEAAKFQVVIDGVNKSLGLGEKELNDYAKANVEVVRGFNALNAQWQALMVTFGRIFQPAVSHALKTIFDTFERNMPMIKAIVEGVGKAFAFLVNMFAQLVVIFGAVMTGFQTLGRLVHAIVPGLDNAKMALVAFGAALMLSPIGMFLKMMTALMLLMDDYQSFSEGGFSHFDWSSFDAFKDWVTDLTGVDGLLTKILGTLGAIAVAVKVVEWGSWLATLGRAAPAAAAARAGAGVAGAASTAARVTPLRGVARLAAPVVAGAAVYEAASDPRAWYQKWKDAWTTGTFNWGGSAPAPAGGAPMPTGGGPNIPADQLPQLPGNPDYGTRANNPGNLNLASWEPAVGGATYMDRTEGRQHTMARFRTMAEGVAASATLLMRNQAGGDRTIAGAFKGYATSPYFQDLARQMGLNAGTSQFDVAKIARENPELLAKLLEAKYKHEGRAMQSGALTHAQVMEGIALAARPGGFALPGHQVGGSGVTMNQSTTINVAPGPNATETASRVAGEQRRVNETMVRNTGNVVR